MPNKRYESQKQWNSQNYVQLNIAVRPELAVAFRSACEQAQTPMREALITFMSKYCETPPVHKEQKGVNYAVRSNRRKATAAIVGELEKIRDAEEKYMQNMPINLQNSSRYEAAEQTVEALDESIGILGEAFV